MQFCACVDLCVYARVYVMANGNTQQQSQPFPYACCNCGAPAAGDYCEACTEECTDCGQRCGKVEMHDGLCHVCERSQREADSEWI